MVRIGKESAKHLYELGTPVGIIEVSANSRAQAHSIAKRAGYVVNFVNMVG